MRKEINLQKRDIICAITIFVGLILSFIGGTKLIGYNNAKECNSSNLKIGEYVSCDVREYLVKEQDNLGNLIDSGQCEVIVEFMKDFYVYNIPLDDGSYVRIKIFDNNEVENLEDYTKGKSNGKNVVFIGKVTKSEEVSSEWYESISNFNFDDLNKEICILEVNKNDYKNTLLFGVVLFFIGLICLLSTKRAECNFIEDIREADYNKLPRYNAIEYKEDCIERLKKIEKLQRKNYRKLSVGLFFLIAGIIFVIKFYFFEIKIIGIIGMILGMKIIWNIFINSDLKFAVKISRFFNLNTYSVKKIEIQSIIDEINLKKY